MIFLPQIHLSAAIVPIRVRARFGGKMMFSWRIEYLHLREGCDIMRCVRQGVL